MVPDHSPRGDGSRWERQRKAAEVLADPRGMRLAGARIESTQSPYAAATTAAVHGELLLLQDSCSYALDTLRRLRIGKSPDS